MSKVILYIATSLDGYIARPDGNLDWLTSTPNPDEGDYGYEDLLARIKTIIMGRKTYDEVMGFGIEWPYTGYKTYVVSTDKNYATKSPDTFALTDDLKEFVLETKRNSEKDIWLVGGGQLISTFLENDLLDRMIITIVPKNLGDGIRLFPNKTKDIDWKLIEAKPFNTGLVNLTYDRLECRSK